jgi:hypothetical protein
MATHDWSGRVARVPYSSIFTWGLILRHTTQYRLCGTLQIVSVLVPFYMDRAGRLRAVV